MAAAEGGHLINARPGGSGPLLLEARYGESRALGWIQEACGAAKVNGHELFAELQAGSDEAARAGARRFKEEQLRLRPRPS
ncbi:MAG: hypothetical protein EBS05_21880 [Proteobacteria bacterium]|nr:hypothetical protein [Pseudomonadota bacterium]